MISNKNKKYFNNSDKNDKISDKLKISEESKKRLVDSIAEKNRNIKIMNKSLDNMKLIAAGSILLALAIIAATCFR